MEDIVNIHRCFSKFLSQNNSNNKEITMEVATAKKKKKITGRQSDVAKRGVTFFSHMPANEKGFFFFLLEMRSREKFSKI